MDIWIINQYAITPQLPGGSRHFDFGRELVKRGHKVTVFASSFHYSLRRETEQYADAPYKIKNTEGIRFISIKTPPYKKNNWRRLVNVLTYCRRVKKIAKILPRPDVIIGSSPDLFAAKAAQKLAEKFDIPFVMEVRDLWPHTLISMGISKMHPAVIAFAALEKNLYKKSNAIVTLMPRAHRHIQKYGVGKEKITWISNGANPEKFQNITSPQKNTVRYMGTIGPPNNVELLIKMAKLLPRRVRIEIIGEGILKETLQKKAPVNVKFTEPVPKENVPKLLQESDVIFITADEKRIYRHGISMNKIFDGLAAGRPIVYACRTANNPIKEAGAGLTVPPDDPQKAADAVKKLFAMPQEEKNKMGLRGRAYMRKHYSIPVLVDKLEKVLHSVTQKT